MKKFTFIMIALLVASMGFAQNQLPYKTASTPTKTTAKNFYTSNANTTATASAVRATRDNVTIFSEDFEFSGTELENGWTSYDQDGDNYDWQVWSSTEVAHTGTKAMASASYNNDVGALTPNNWLISPAINLSAQTGTIKAGFWVKGMDASWPREHYKVCISTSADVASFSTILYEETIPSSGWFERTVDISAYGGESTIYIAFVHYNVTDMYNLVLDDFSVYVDQGTDAAVTAITAPNHGDYSTCALTNAEQVKINILNNGGAAISNFQVSYAINGGTPVTETVTASVAPAQTYEYTFNQTANLSTVGTYEITASINLTGDEVAANNTANMSITNGDATIRIHAQTNSYSENGHSSWTVTNTLTNQVVAERPSNESWQWYIEVNDYVCVDANGCYTVEVLDADGLALPENDTEHTPTYLEILYNGTQVAGSTEPNSFTGPSLIAERIGGGCSSDPEIATADSTYSFITVVGTETQGQEAVIRAYNLTAEITATTTAPFEISADNSAFATSAVLPTNGGSLYIRFNPTTAGQHTGTVTLSSTGAQNITIPLTGKAVDCSNISTPWEETFNEDSDTRLCWSVIDGNSDDNSYQLVNGTEETGAVMLLTYSMNQEDYLVSPEMTLGNNASVTFKTAHYTFQGTPYPETYEVYVFTETDQIKVQDATETTTLFPTMETVTVSLAEYAGQVVNVAVKCISEDAYWFILDDFSFNGTVAANENIAEAVAVYPNPTKDMVTVANAEGKNIVIVNSLGQVVANIENAAANQTIDVANFANGTYFVKVDAEVVKLNVVK